ncbi:MAG: TlpA disulfide reductase family protein [Rubripirellula sp.]
MKFRLSLTLLMCCAIGAWTLKSIPASAEDLGIGSQAPPLDVEHWVQDGNGFFRPVEDFEEGKVYVVEFWATWCGPCIASMPHLAELQEKYRGRDVQIISISDESLDEVKDLLAKDNEQVGKTFAEVTAAYSLTTDPDRSVYKDYMDASNQQGIPTSFIVGKNGLIEWIGHPMEMDEPLEMVVNDSWDREKFKEELKAKEEFQKNMERISMLAGAGKFADAVKFAESQAEAAATDSIRDEWTAIRHSLKLSGNMLDDESIAFFRTRLTTLKGDPYSIARFGYSLYGQSQQGADITPLAGDVVAAIEGEMEGAEDQLKPLMLNTIAMLANETGDVAKAIEAQEAAVEAAPNDRQKQRLMPFLEELKEKASEEDAEK